jgi:tetratricopeptide (TPR) repeat protein
VNLPDVTGGIAWRADRVGLFDSFKKKFSPSKGESRTSLSRKIQESPQDPQARQKLGLFLLRQGEIVEGNDQLARAAILYEKGGFTAKAIAVVRQLVKNDPTNVEFHQWLIRLLAQHGHTADAQNALLSVSAGEIRFPSDEKKIEFYQGVAESLPDNPLPSLLIADIYLYQRKLFEAIGEMARIVPLVALSEMEKDFASRMNVLTSLTGDNPELLEPCGFLWVSAGKPEEALPYLKKAAEHARSSGDSDRGEEAEKVISLLEDGQAEAFTGAMSFPDALQRIQAHEEPSPPPAEEKKPSPREEGGDESMVQSAVDKLQAKVKEEIGETDPEARYNLGIAYKEMGLLDEAAEEFRLSRSKPALFLGASCLLAETFAEKGDLAKALETFDEVLAAESISPDEARDVRYQKAILLTQNGKEEDAKEIFLSLYESSPDYRDLRKRVQNFQG